MFENVLNSFRIILNRKWYVEKVYFTLNKSCQKIIISSYFLTKDVLQRYFVSFWKSNELLMKYYYKESLSHCQWTNDGHNI